MKIEFTKEHSPKIKGKISDLVGKTCREFSLATVIPKKNAAKKFSCVYIRVDDIWYGVTIRQGVVNWGSGVLEPNNSEQAKTVSSLHSTEHIQNQKYTGFSRYLGAVFESVEYVTTLHGMTRIIFTFEKGLVAILDELENELTLHIFPKKNHVACHFCSEKQRLDSDAEYAMHHGVVICRDCVALSLGACLKTTEKQLVIGGCQVVTAGIVRCHCCGAMPSKAAHMINNQNLNICSNCVNEAWELLVHSTKTPKILNIDLHEIESYTRTHLRT